MKRSDVWIVLQHMMRQDISLFIASAMVLHIWLRSPRRWGTSEKFTENVSPYGAVKPYDVFVELNLIDASNLHKVMIVAHPDDESLWGRCGASQDKYLVVNVTCGVVGSRVDELRAAMRYSRVIPLMLLYPDI